MYQCCRVCLNNFVIKIAHTIYLGRLYVRLHDIVYVPSLMAVTGFTYLTLFESLSGGVDRKEELWNSTSSVRSWRRKQHTGDYDLL